MPTFEAHGYKVLGIIVREQTHKKQTRGRKRRSFYEGKFVYVRVRLVDGRRRDIYLGTPAAAARRRQKTGVEKEGVELSSSTSPARGGESGWRNDRLARAERFPRGPRRR